MMVSFLLAVPIYLCFASVHGQVSSRSPNVVIFLADDLGIGDVGCFGNTSLPTPNIDRIGREGALFTHHLTSSSVCTPSRTSLLTGRYAIRAGLETSNILPVILFVASAAGLPTNETSFADLAKSQGYSTALIGKWHIGMSCSRYGDFCHHPRNHGFDYFYGLPLTNLKDFGNSGESVVISQMPVTNRVLLFSFLAGVFSTGILHKRGRVSKGLSVSLILISLVLPLALYLSYKNITLLNSILMKDFEVVEQPIRLDTLTRRFVHESVEFLEKQKESEKPFVLFVSWTHVHTYIMTARTFKGRSKHGTYGDGVMELDWGVGQILNALDNLGFTNNTFVYFTSDNGAHIEERGKDGSVMGGHNGIFKGGKTHGGVDGGIRVPAVVRYPGQIPPGTVISEPTSLMDFLPTLANIIKAPLPTDRVIDGQDMMPLLKGEETLSRHEFLYHYCGKTIHAARYRPRKGNDVYKLVYWTPNYLSGQTRCDFVCFCGQAHLLDPPLLYNMVTDPRELTPLNISTEPRYNDLVSVIEEAVEEHKQSVIPVPDQYSIVNLLWRPWLQPCCNFPRCSCKDLKYADMEF